MVEQGWWWVYSKALDISLFCYSTDLCEKGPVLSQCGLRKLLQPAIILLAQLFGMNNMCDYMYKKFCFYYYYYFNFKGT